MLAPTGAVGAQLVQLTQAQGINRPRLNTRSSKSYMPVNRSQCQGWLYAVLYGHYVPSFLST